MKDKRVGSIRNAPSNYTTTETQEWSEVPVLKLLESVKHAARREIEEGAVNFTQFSELPAFSVTPTMPSP